METADETITPARPRRSAANDSNGANVGFEAKLWQAADALRGSMDASEYKHGVLGLLFLKYISDACGQASSGFLMALN